MYSYLDFAVIIKAHSYKSLALTFSVCLVDFRWLTGVTLAHFIDGTDPETIRHVRPQREAGVLLIPTNSLQLLPTPLLQVLVLKLNQILWRKSNQEVTENDRR